MSNDPANPDSSDALSERWVLVLRDAGSEIPVAMRMKALLKRAGRDWKFRCCSLSSTTPSEQLAASRAEVLRLREALAKAERIAGQAEALARRAEKPARRKRVAAR